MNALVVVVTYNSAEHIDRLLDSLRTSPATLRTVVVDNGSRDDTVARVRRHDGVEVVATGQNLGYSGGINVGRRHRRDGEHLVVLNPDLELGPHALQRLLGAVEDPTVGMAAPVLLDEHGDVAPHLRREATVLGALGDALLGRRWPNRPALLAETYWRTEDYERGHDVGWAGGAALVVSARADDLVGDWDSDTYFLYSEEADYARRVREHDLRVRFVPEAQVTHAGEGSGQPAALLAMLAQNRVTYYSARHGATSTAAFRSVVVLHHLLRARDPRHRHAAHAVLRWTPQARPASAGARPSPASPSAEVRS